MGTPEHMWRLRNPRERSGRGERWRRTPLGAIAIAFVLAACGADDVETSDQLISVSPTTVAPVPADRSPEELTTAAWCEDLADADADRVQDVYRRGAELSSELLATAAELLASGEGTITEIEDAGEEVEGACATEGVNLDAPPP